MIAHMNPTSTNKWSIFLPLVCLFVLLSESRTLAQQLLASGTVTSTDVDTGIVSSNGASRVGIAGPVFVLDLAVPWVSASAVTDYGTNQVGYTVTGPHYPCASSNE